MDQQTRFFLGWMEQEEGIQNLLGHLPAENEGFAEQAALWQQARQAVQNRAPFGLPVPTLQAPPPALTDAVAAFRQRPDVLAAFHTFDWTVGMADLNLVLSFQKQVLDDEAAARASTVQADDPLSLFSYCLPDPAAQAPMPVIIDDTQKSFTISSPNPNLRIMGLGQAAVPVTTVPGQQPVNQILFGFAIWFGTPFLQIAEYNGRWFIRDGYHRCYGLLRRGISVIPCIFIRARSFAELGASAPGFFSYDTLFGQHPPFARDLLDDTVTASATQIAKRKVVRMKAEEFFVQV